MSRASTARAPVFNSINVSYNLRIFKEFCDDIEYGEKEILRRVERYCADLYLKRQLIYIKELANRDWEVFKKELKKA